MSQHPQHAMTRLNVLALFEQRVAKAPTFEAAEEGLEAVKAEADRVWKDLAQIAHPDHGGSTEEMQELNAARDTISQIRIERPRPRTVVIVQIFHTPSYGFGTSSTTSTGGW